MADHDGGNSGKKGKGIMIFKEKHIVLKNGTDCILRSPGPEDAEAILSYLKQASEETTFITRYPEEVTMTVDHEEEFLANYQADQKSMMISAVVDGKIVACTGLSCVQDTIKCRHRGVFGISVQKSYWNLGIATALITELIECAKKAGFEQLELEVVCENQQALRLYQKLGFEKYGTRERSFKHKDGSYSSEYLMLLRLC
ncbi:MAG: GNAT family N-acetyltransferase [Bacillota bacterium]